MEVVSGDCLVVADDSIPFGSPMAERRVRLSSIRSPKMGNPRREEKPAPYAREAREFLRQRLIGKQVYILCVFLVKLSRHKSKISDLFFPGVGYRSNGILKED